MCGILGTVRTDGQPLSQRDRSVFQTQIETLFNRGPDGEGLFAKDNVAIGHRRLAIRDLANGQQPWVASRGGNSCVLTYNGELYNEQQLRAELSSQYEFKTTCDTEVVMAAYLRWGKECVHRLSGMFSLGVYDFRERSLWLVRDRFGIKPLYFAHLPDRFVFASDIATLLCEPGLKKQPDWQAVSHYLTTLRVTLGSRTIYSGINCLQPAEEATLVDGQFNVRRYWKYPSPAHSDVSFEEATDLFEEKLNDAVATRLVSDVPVGVFLSGGVDSCTLTAMVNRSRDQELLAFCATTQNEPNELHHAKACADHFGVNLTSVDVDANAYLSAWLKLIGTFRQPLSTPSDVVISQLARIAKRHVGVVLGGEGADELLSGYEVASWSPYDLDATRVNNPCQQLLESIQRQYGRTSFRDQADHYFALNSLIPTSAKQSILASEIVRSLDNDRAIFDQYQTVFNEAENCESVEKQSRLLHRINLESLLARLDRMTMSVGLEARVPFTDHELVELVYSFPIEFRIDALAGTDLLSSAELSAAGRLRSKRILRTIAGKLLPDKLAKRKKASFPTGLNRWLSSDWTIMLASYLEQSPFARFMMADAFRSELISSPKAAGMWLWPIANLAFWGDAEFFDAPVGEAFADGKELLNV